jgi:hypothetical protein
MAILSIEDQEYIEVMENWFQSQTETIKEAEANLKFNIASKNRIKRQIKLDKQEILIETARTDRANLCFLEWKAERGIN